MALLLPVRDGKTRWKTRLKMVDKSIGWRVYNKVCKLEKVAYTLFNLREV